MKGIKQFQERCQTHLRHGIAIVTITIAVFVLSFAAIDAGQAELLIAPETASTASLEQSTGQVVFTNTCSACHIGGTNVIVPQKTLTQEALEKYAMDSIGAITQQVTYGKNAMPAFGSRLTPEQIDAVAGYVLEQADSGW